jgi:hypothetical protein
MEIKSNQDTTLNKDLFEMLPESLKVLLKTIKQQHYEELYEPEAGGNSSLQDALQEVLEAFRESDNKLCHLRYVWLTLILILVVEPTVEYYQLSNYLAAKSIIQLIGLWVVKTAKLISYKIKYPKSFDKEIKLFLPQGGLENTPRTGSFQTITEVVDVFNNAIRVLDEEQSVEAILDILNDCLEGYAIFPGSTGRREVFDWWIDEVVPASWFLLPPKSFYVVEGLPNREEIKIRQSKKLEKISSMVYFILKEQVLTNEEKVKDENVDSWNKISIRENPPIKIHYNCYHSSILNAESNKSVVFSTLAI